MKREKIYRYLFVFAFTLYAGFVSGQGEASTYFNFFVPPNNDPVKRNVCLVVTAIFDDTSFEIVDDGADGDTDDNKSGTLSKGQSYILYIADNGINDDARYASGGVLKQDGDYFIVRSSKNVLVSQSTDSDWQHDFVPSIGQKGIGEKFIVYAPKISSSKRDLNTFVYEDSTLVTIKKISASATTISGYTHIDYANATIVGSQLLNRGQDLIYFKTLGRDVMESGHTYLVEASKPVTLQYGALFGNERDGGGNVPSSNGSSSGDLFYFAVPYQSSGEQEIRIVSWDNDNAVTLERYSAGSWITMKNWNLGRYGFSDWVGKSDGNASYATIFRIKCTSGKRVSVFEANWLETGNPGTSDIGSMLSSENGTSSGNKFIAYIAPPGNEQNVRNPFTGTLFGQQLSHLYISTRTGARVTVKDAYTGGTDFTRTYHIAAERYVDCYLTLEEWKKIYNGTGTTAGGPKRPYLIVESDKPVSVFNTNFNDNWMAYLGTAQSQGFSLNTTAPSSAVIPGDTSTVITKVIFKTATEVTNGSATIQAEGNVQIVSSNFSNSSGTVTPGVVSNDAKSVAYESLPPVSSDQTYEFTTKVIATVADQKGNLLLGNSIGALTTSFSGSVEGIALQSVSSEGIFVNSADQSQLLFSRSTDATWDNLLTNSWTTNLIDYNNDGWDDIFITDQDKTKPNYLFKNNGNKTFTKVTTGELVLDQTSTVSSSWADVDNDGDIDVVVANNTGKPNSLYLNNGNGTFTKNKAVGFVQQPGYYHNSTWIDYDNDGLLDLFLCNYWPTKFNELWHNDGDGNYSLQTNSKLSQTAGSSASAAWADYDNDGLLDVFLPNNKGGKNLLYHNDGNGRFSEANTIVTQEGGFSVASCWGDVDGNGYADLFVANASSRDNYLYLNQGNGNFTKVSTGDVVHDGGHSHGCSFADIDNDGDIDLYVNNDNGTKFLYLNDGNGSFKKQVNEVITVDYGLALGHAWADLDKDGDLDLFSVTHSNQRNHLFWNNGNANHWLQVKLVGLESNKSAIGARIRLKSNGKWQTREVTSQSGIGGQNSYRNHFGLGATASIDSLVIQWPSGAKQVITNIVSNQFLSIAEQTGSKVIGSFFADENNNCTKEISENYLPNQKIRISPLNIILVTDQNGTINTNLLPGQYTFELVDISDYKSECRGAAITLDIANAGQLVSLGEIGLKPSCNCTDAGITMAGTAKRRGFGSDYVVQVANTGTLDMENVEVKLTVPAKLHFSRANPAWNSQQDKGEVHEYIWSVSNLKSNETNTIIIRDSVTLNLQVGDVVTVTGEVSTDGSEINFVNNVFNDINEIVGAIDPNMIIASPKGYGAEHLMEAGKEITYKVLFENFGNYATSFVTVTDTLDQAFDLASLHDIQSSHGPLRTSIRGNIVTFHFPDIQLTPTAEDSVQSQGYVQFRVRTKQEATGPIYNRASIVFDYNEPIITNSEKHTLFNKQGLERGQLVLFPNPVSGSVDANIFINPANERDAAIVEATIMDIQGIVRARSTFDEVFITLNTSNLLNGIYLVQVKAKDGLVYTTKMVINK